jgi:two-component system KDP operon response regulator KdpE
LKVLIIEDDPATIEAVSLAFEFRWPEVKLVSTTKGTEGAELVEKESPDVVVLDLGLPDIDGMEVLKEIRQFSDVPVIILTARTEDRTVVRGLESGADDYVTKPFDSMVLLARVKNVLGRTKMPELRGDRGRIGGRSLVIDLATRQVIVNGNPVALTATEWTLLSELVRNEGRVLSQQRLAEKLWGEDAGEFSSAIRSYIARLRTKLGDDPKAPRIILTEYGIGYRFVRPK